mgnify:FL=1
MIHQLFSTPLYIDKISSYYDIQKEFTRVKEVFDTEIGWDDLWDSHLITDSKFQDNIIDEHNITKFKDEITYHIREYSGTDRPFKINN